MYTEFHTQKEASPMPRNDRDEPLEAPSSLTVATGNTLRSGVPIVAGFMPISVLIPGNYSIPTYDPRTGKGYQRPSQDARVNELAADLRKKRVDLPTAILLNLRNREARQALAGGKLDLTTLRDSVASRSLFYVVDGQHRILALQKLIDEDGFGQWGEYLIPFVCMVGATEAEEMEQFYVVNSRAKSVRTDLAFALLKKLSDKDEKMLQRLEEKGKAWQVKAEKIVEEIAENSQVWRGLIRLPAMEKGGTTMPSASFVTSMKPLLDYPFFSRLSFEQQVQVLEAFWRGLRDVMRPAFDGPQDYVVQKGVGVIVMHAVLVDVLEIARSNGKSVVEAATFSELMREAISELAGEAQDGVGTPVGGIDFWRTAPDGAAGSYSSSAGRKVLIAKIRQLLPHVEAL